jgi:hypothetical protein
MQKNTLVALVLATILLSSFSVYVLNRGKPKEYKFGVWPEADTAVRQSQHFYLVRRDSGEDLSDGPCIAEKLTSDWAGDLVHNPRQPVDDLPKNQCQSFIKGQVHHFVELDLNGNIVRVQ